MVSPLTVEVSVAPLVIFTRVVPPPAVGAVPLVEVRVGVPVEYNRR